MFKAINCIGYEGITMNTRKQIFLKGMKDGIPIALGYFAVSIALGITARAAGLTAVQASLASFMITASAGEYAGFTLIAAGAGYIEVIVMEAVANARYLLMSCSLSQKLKPDTPLAQRLLMGAGVTDEIFGISINYPGNLNPIYTYGAMFVSIPAWTSGTFLGVVLGNILPDRLVSGLGVCLYGMFIAILIPAAKQNKVVKILVPVCFLISFIFNEFKIFDVIPEGVKVIGLTVVISLAAAVLFPVKDEEKEEKG